MGIGYDAHPLVPRRALVLGGLSIPFERGLLGHSDADVLIHAVIDALLGAAGEKDIGFHFPASDPKYKDISSLKLLSFTSEILKGKGFFVVNIDATIIAQRPKLLPFLEQMRQNIARVLEIAPDSVNIKAKSTEGLGFCGREEGMEAIAVALITQKD